MKGKTRKIEPNQLLKSKRYVFEQLNWPLKANVLRECWLWPRGLAKKAAMVTAGLISYAVEALRSLVCGEKSVYR